MNSCFKFYQRKKLPSHLMEMDLNSTDNTGIRSEKPLPKSPFHSESQESKNGCEEEKWNKIMEQMSKITSQNSKEEKCKDFINSEFSKKLDSVRKSTQNDDEDDCDDLTQQSLAELCDWLITGYQQIAGVDDMCKSQKKDVLLIEIQKNLKQLMALRKRFNERKKCRSFSARKPEKNNAPPDWSTPPDDKTFLRACGSYKNFNNPRKSKQSRKSADAELIKNYNETMKSVCNQKPEGNTPKCNSFDKLKDNKRNSKNFKNLNNCDTNFKDSFPKRKSPDRNQSDLECSSGGESYLPCFQSFKNQKPQSKHGSSSSARKVSQGSKSICGGSFKMNRTPKNSTCKACLSESSETCDIIKDCKKILKMPSQLKVYGLSESPMVVNVRNDGKRRQNCGGSFKSDIDCRQQGLQFDECETAWKQVKRGLKKRDTFYECLQKTIENREPKKCPPKRKDTIESLCSVINMNSNSSVRNFVANNNSSEHNNSRLSDNTFNSLGLKLYSAIKDKFSQSLNIFSPFTNSLRRESNQPSCTMNPQLENHYNDTGNAEQPVPANISYQQLNNSSNNHKGCQPIRSIASKQRVSEPQNQKLDPALKSDWRSKIEYWDITIADVKECSASSSAEDAASHESELSTNKQRPESVKSDEEKGIVDSGTERMRGFIMGELPLLMADINRSDILHGVDMDAVKIIVNSNVNAGQRDAFNLMDICKIKRPKSKTKPRWQPNQKKINNSNSIKNRPPWKHINTSLPPKKLKPRPLPPPLQQTCLVIPNTFIPVRNDSDIVEYPNYIRENDKSNNNCCYCCQQDCCCQQLALQMQLQQHCRYLEDMLERKQEELKAEMRQLHESSSSKRVDDPCANICSNKEATANNDDIIRNCLNQLKKNSTCRDSNQSKARNSAFNAPCGNNGRTSRAKNESWWVDAEKKQKALCQSSSSSRVGPELEDFKNEVRPQSRHRSSKMCDDNQKKEPINSKYKELFRKISSASSCDKICNGKGGNKSDLKKDEKVEKVDGGTNPRPKDKCCQTADSDKQFNNTECQTNEKKKPSREDIVKESPSKDVSIQCENNGNELDKMKQDSDSCEMAFKKCMKQAKEALAEQGPNIDTLERRSRTTSNALDKIKGDTPAARNSQDQPSIPPNQAQRNMMKAMNLNAEDLASKLRDVQTIINAFREKCDKSKKGFKDLKTICKQWQGSTLQPKEDSLDCDFLNNSQTNENLRTKSSKSNDCRVSNAMKDRDCIIPKTKKKSSTIDSYLAEKCQKVSKEKKRPSWGKDNSASIRSDELVHRWIERCLKQKMTKGEKVGNLKSACEVDGRQSRAADKRSSTRDDQTASCDDATWECQLMMDKSPESNALLSPTSRKEQLQNQIMDAIECYCREYGSAVQGRNGCESSESPRSKKRELFKELKMNCKDRDKKSNLKDKSPKGRDRRKKVKLSFEDIVQAKCENKPSRYKQAQQDAISEQKSSFSSNICDQTPSSSFTGPSKSHSQLSCQPSRKEKKAKDLPAACNFSSKKRKKCTFCESSSEESEKLSMSSSEIQKKLSNICRFSRKNFNRSHSNRSCSARFSGVSAGDCPQKSPSRSRKSSTSRLSCPTSSPSSCRPSCCSASLKGNSLASPRRSIVMEKSSTSRESLLSCLQAVLTKRRLERAIKEECLKWDVRRSCQLEKIEKCL